MGRNEIRLRRHTMSAGNIARHRNYGALMERHERNQKIRRMAKFFIYFLLIAFLLIIFIIIVRWEKRQDINIEVEKQSISEMDNRFTIDPSQKSVQTNSTVAIHHYL